MTDIVQLLGNEADSLLQHRCMTIPADSLYLPGADYVDRVMIDNNRSPAVLRNMQTLYNTGRPAGTGYLLSCRLIRAWSIPLVPLSPPIRSISIRRISSNWRWRRAVTASPQPTVCWRRCRAVTPIKSHLWSS